MPRRQEPRRTGGTRSGATMSITSHLLGEHSALPRLETSAGCAPYAAVAVLPRRTGRTGNLWSLQLLGVGEPLMTLTVRAFMAAIRDVRTITVACNWPDYGSSAGLAQAPKPRRLRVGMPVRILLGASPTQTGHRQSRRHRLPLPGTDVPQAANSNFLSEIVLEARSTDIVDSPGQDYRSRLRTMISFMISMVPPKIDWTRLSRQGPALRRRALD
jgi:hypothetical protein